MSEDYDVIAFMAVVAVFCCSLFGMIAYGSSKESEVTVACIQAGKDWVDSSCVEKTR